MIYSNDELIQKAKSIVKPKKVKHGFTTSDCGCALVTDKGNIYLGVSVDTCSGMGFCAEHSATAAMITGGEYKIKTIVAVLEDGMVLPPCGRCREFMYQVDGDNLEADVIVGEGKVVKFKGVTSSCLGREDVNRGREAAKAVLEMVENLKGMG